MLLIERGNLWKCRSLAPNILQIHGKGKNPPGILKNDIESYRGLLRSFGTESNMSLAPQRVSDTYHINNQYRRRKAQQVSTAYLLTRRVH